jgi:hypothetical protein
MAAAHTGEGQLPAVERGDQVGSENGGVKLDEGVVELTRLPQTAQVGLVAERGKIIEDHGELIDFETILDGHREPGRLRVCREPNLDRSIVNFPGHGVALGRTRKCDDRNNKRQSYEKSTHGEQSIKHLCRKGAKSAKKRTILVPLCALCAPAVKPYFGLQ